MRQTKLLFLLLLALFMSATGRMPRRWEHSSPLTALPTRLRKRTHYGYLCASIPRSIAAQSERRKRQLLLRDDRGAGWSCRNCPIRYVLRCRLQDGRRCRGHSGKERRVEQPLCLHQEQGQVPQDQGDGQHHASLQCLHEREFDIRIK